MENETIEVAINISDYPKDLNMEPLLWAAWITSKLKNAGIPISGMTMNTIFLKKGTLTRLDDPCDFGSSKYIWVSK